jgi:hypothetical protein
MNSPIFSGVALAAALSIAPANGFASVIGFLGNFDVINDTGSMAHGFEIDLEGLHSSDITDTFGGAGRGFPSGRGFDPRLAVQRYGAPTIADYSSGSVFGVRVTYSGLFDGTRWDYGTPSGSFVTPGDNCWTGGGVGYGASTPCDHFGVGTSSNATRTTYSWLLETAPGSGNLSKGGVVLPTPVWEVIPAPQPPAANQPLPPPVVVARIRAPDPAPGKAFGDAIWVKVFTTELPEAAGLEELVRGNAKVNQAELETEWFLLQVEAGNPLAGQLESGKDAPVRADAATIIRRYEFFRFSGDYDKETHEAKFSGKDELGNKFGDANPGPDDIGTYLGAQNAALNLAAVAAVPEPETALMLLAGLGLVAAAARRRRSGGAPRQGQ